MPKLTSCKILNYSIVAWAWCLVEWLTQVFIFASNTCHSWNRILKYVHWLMMIFYLSKFRLWFVLPSKCRRNSSLVQLTLAHFAMIYSFLQQKYIIERRFITQQRLLMILSQGPWRLQSVPLFILWTQPHRSSTDLHRQQAAILLDFFLLRFGWIAVINDVWLVGRLCLNHRLLDHVMYRKILIGCALQPRYNRRREIRRSWHVYRNVDYCLLL